MAVAQNTREIISHCVRGFCFCTEECFIEADQGSNKNWGFIHTMNRTNRALNLCSGFFGCLEDAIDESSRSAERGKVLSLRGGRHNPQQHVLDQKCSECFLPGIASNDIGLIPGITPLDVQGILAAPNQFHSEFPLSLVHVSGAEDIDLGYEKGIDPITYAFRHIPLWGDDIGCAILCNRRIEPLNGFERGLNTVSAKNSRQTVEFHHPLPIKLVA